MDGLADCALIRHFSQLEDPRTDRQKKQMLIDVVVIAICSTLCGGTSFEDFEDFGLEKFLWLKTFLDLPNGIPSQDTFNRVFARIKPQKFLGCQKVLDEGADYCIALKGNQGTLHQDVQNSSR
jgi:hypothetical protein